MTGPNLLDYAGRFAFVSGAGQGAGWGIALMPVQHNAGGVAAMVLFLCSDAASRIAGQTYPVNGGYRFAM